MEKVQIKFVDGRVINLNLYEDVAPISVSNFLHYVDQGFYDGLCFHRVIPSFMVQGGGFKWENGLCHKEGDRGPIVGEFGQNGIRNDLNHLPGVISMARTMFKDSATTQFFICVDDCSFLDGQYAAFGMVADEESLAVAIDISEVKTTSWNGYGDVPVEPVVIESIRRI